MGLIKRSEVENSRPLYRVELPDGSNASVTLLIVGLGNIGKEYELTRHNAGFIAIDHFMLKNNFTNWSNKKSLKCEISEGNIDGNKVVLIKPSTFMNNSGQSVAAVQKFYKIKNTHTLVVHDDIDIDFGQIRLRNSGASAGHNGIKSVIAACGEDFGRLRIGIGPKKPTQIASEDFVLKNFSKKEIADLPSMKQEINAVLSEYCFNKGRITPETRSFLI